jgi:hypothetical protein
MGKYVVVGVDTFDHSDWLDGTFNTLCEAIRHANERGGTMLKMHVYDDMGRHMHDAGKF